MPMPKRIQRKQTKGWRMPEGAVYVGRGTVYGNPFRGDDAVEKYREAISRFPVEGETYTEWTNAGGSAYGLVGLAGRVEWIIEKLRGKDLACWCPLDKPCHADVLLEIANRGGDT